MLTIVASMFMKDIAWFQYLGNFVVVEYSGHIPSFSVFQKSLCRRKIFLQMFETIHLYTIWCVSLCGEVLNYKFLFKNRYKAIQVIYFFFTDLWSLVSFKEFVCIFYVVQIIGTELFIIFPYYFSSIARICNYFTSLTAIGYFYLPYFFS